MKQAIMFLSGFAIGCVGGYFFGKSKFEKIAEEEISEMRSHYKEKLDEFVANAKETLEEKAETVIHNHNLDKPSLEELREKYMPSTNEPPFDEEEEPPMDNNYIPPRLISSEEYGEMVGYSYEELLYYQDNDTLINEDEEVIEDPAKIVGTAMIKYDFVSTNEEDIFVRNDNLRTDYHIHKVFNTPWEG